MRNILTGAILALLMVGTSVAQADRSHPPELGAPAALTLPEIHHFTLSNGLKVILMEKHQTPLVQINLLVSTGAVADPAGLEGLASVTTDMMDEGAGSYDAFGLADAVEYLGAQLFSWSGTHTMGVDLFTPLSKIDAGLKLLVDVSLHPTFPAAELDRLRDEGLTNIIQSHDEPRTIAVTAFNRELFGGNHAYGRSTSGTEASLRAMELSHVKDFYSTWFRPNNASLIIVGDVNADQMKPMLEAAFGSWEAADVPEVMVANADQVAGRKVIFVDKPGAAQSVIRIGRVGVSRDTPDFLPITVMNTILGGSFSSRLNQNLREEHGYSYGAGSAFVMRQAAGAFLATSSVQTDVSGPALTEFMNELTAIRDVPPAEDVARAKNYVALGVPSDFRTITNVADELATLVTYNLPDTYFNEYITGILNVTDEQVHQAAQKYIDLENMVIVVVGDRDAVGADVEALNLGEITYLTVEDVLGAVPSMGAVPALGDG